MALLAAAIGNGSTHLGLLSLDGAGGGVDPSDDAPLASWRVASDPARTPDEWSALVGTLLAGVPGAPPVEGLATCSAVPAVLQAWREMAETRFAGRPHVVVGPGVRTGLTMRVDSPREIGADRVVNALAASAYPLPAVVVDLGVATTFDVVDGTGAYLGGAIAPGIAISLDALARHGAQLRTVELAAPRSVIARNTVEALQSGMVFGYAALVDGMIARIESEITEECRTVIATGPLAPVVVDTCAGVSWHSPWLTLRGLRILYRKNR